MFAQSIFDGVRAHQDLLTGAAFPSIAVLDARLGAPLHPYSGAPLRLRGQTAALLADGLHYETRILERGEIATRADNWHDLLNALIWYTALSIKAAMNHRQQQEIQHQGSTQRSRPQCALTHFDEAGVLVVLRDASRLAAWDRHDWPGLFVELQPCDYAIVVFGHALLEHALEPQRFLVGKALVAVDPQPHQAIEQAIAELARQIGEGRVLNDPQELRPLPLAGLPGWHSAQAEAGFWRDSPCFQPLREGRCYPPALRLSAIAGSVESV